jgi:predicted small metal-binding protein
MEKRLKAKVTIECGGCGWTKEWEVRGDTEEEIAEEAHKSCREHLATHKREKNAPWRLQWGPVEFI